jgi:proteasome lid subunit RPN8/RPN11
MRADELERHWREEFERLSREEAYDAGEGRPSAPFAFKIIAITALAVFVLIIFVFYFTTNPTIRGIIAGLIESSPVREGVVDIGSGNKLFFLNNTYNKLIRIYDANPEKEFKVCLKGKVSAGDYLIYEVYEPTMVFQSHNRVIADPCPEDALVSMHSHPFRHCLPSEQDFRSFESFKKTNQNAVMAVMCEKGRFNFYR